MIGSKKIRIYPTTPKQKQILNSLFGASRFFYNRTIAYLKAPGTIANRFSIQKELLAEVPEWAQDVPYKVKQMAIDDACKAVKNAKAKYHKTGQIQSCRFRCRKDRRDSIYVPKNSVNALGVYPRLVGPMRVTERIENVEFDCKLIHDDGRFWIVLPYRKQIKHPENQRKALISLDPGVRTFLTGFDTDGYVKFGSKDFNRIFRLLYRLDSCLSKRSKSKRRYNRAISSLRFKVKNLISEAHAKIASLLVRSYDLIILPEFSSSGKMLTKLSSKTCRAMLTWAHSKFRSLLIFKAKEYSAEVLLQNEAFTSKTCSFCGRIQAIGSKSVMSCVCGKTIDRDCNGARGILLRAMIDHPGVVNACTGNES